MRLMNNTEAILTQTVEQLERMNEALTSLRRESLRLKSVNEPLVFTQGLEWTHGGRPSRSSLR